MLDRCDPPSYGRTTQGTVHRSCSKSLIPGGQFDHFQIVCGFYICEGQLIKYSRLGVGSVTQMAKHMVGEMILSIFSF